MSNTRSTSLRPSVSLLALLVVACMIVVTPASAAWKTHRAPAAERAALALRATNGQAVEAKRTAGRIDRQLQDLRREQTRLTLLEQAARAELSAAAPAAGGRATALLVVVARERRVLERTRRQLRADLAVSRAEAAKAQARRELLEQAEVQWHDEDSPLHADSLAAWYQQADLQSQQPVQDPAESAAAPAPPVVSLIFS